jgi:pimeloyl-ACP methyl ester carboxylesterase
MTSAAQFAGHAELPGVRLWYTDSGGDGVPVVLLHANTGNADGFQYNIPAFVEAGYRPIAFDRRGWGRSTATPGTGSQPGTIAEDLHALEYLSIDRFHLVGVAGGGFTAYDYVLWHPERLRSLVVAASGGPIVDEELSKLREKTMLPGFRSWPPEFREVSMGYTASDPEGLKRWLEIHNNWQQKGAPVQPQRTGPPTGWRTSRRARMPATAAVGKARWVFRARGRSRSRAAAGAGASRQQG